MNAFADTDIDASKLNVIDRTSALLTKADAILSLMIDTQQGDISGAAWAVRDMVSELAELHGWR